MIDFPTNIFSLIFLLFSYRLEPTMRKMTLIAAIVIL